MAILLHKYRFKNSTIIKQRLAHIGRAYNRTNLKKKANIIIR